MRGINGLTKIKSDRYSEPLAPPPLEPLPERPRLTRSSTTELLPPIPSGKGSLRRRYSDRTSPSPSPTGSSQNDSFNVKSLIDALTMKDDKVKKLELMLLQEREARENAEKRAKTFEENPEGVYNKEAPNGVALHDADAAIQNKENGDVDHDEKTDLARKGLEGRLQKLLVDMENMKKAVAHYQRAAKIAENEASGTRRTLERVIQGMQGERATLHNAGEDQDGTAENKEEIISKVSAEQQHRQQNKDSRDEAFEDTTTNNDSNGATAQRSLFNPQALEAKPPSGQSSVPSTSDKPRDSSPSSPSAKHHTRKDSNGHVLEQAAPYASFLTVVMFGVGLMAYLNGWSRVDK